MRLATTGLALAAVAIAAVSLETRTVHGDDENTKPFDLDMKDADVTDVIAEIGRLSGKENLVVEKGVHDRITIQLNRVTWKEAVAQAASLASCRIELQGPVTFIKKAGTAAPQAGTGGGDAGKSTFREYPIGDEVEREKEHLKVAAVWLPPVTMDHDMGPGPGPFTIHLECDCHALRGNENGFAVGDWIPYMSIEYEITKEGDEKPCLNGELMPMVAKDGPHYGATLAMPGTGRYKLRLKLYPPSKNGLGRHTDSVTGVAEWWAPFETTYSWDYKGLAPAK